MEHSIKLSSGIGDDVLDPSLYRILIKGVAISDFDKTKLQLFSSQAESVYECSQVAKSSSHLQDS